MEKLNGDFLGERPATFQKQCLAGLRESAGKTEAITRSRHVHCRPFVTWKPRVREVCTHRFPELIDRYDCCVVAPSDFFEFFVILLQLCFVGRGRL